MTFRLRVLGWAVFILWSAWLPTTPVRAQTPPVSLPGNEFCDPIRPEVTSLTDGGFLTAWTDADPPLTQLYTRRFDASGSSVGPAVLRESSELGLIPRVAASPDGGFVLAWTEGNTFAPRTLVVQDFDAAGRARGGPLLMETDVDSGLALAGGPDEFLIAATTRSGEIRVTRFDASGDVRSVETIQSSAPGAVLSSRLAVAILANGDSAVAYSERGSLPSRLLLRTFGPDGGDKAFVEVAEDFDEPRLAALPEGDLVLLATSSEFLQDWMVDVFTGSLERVGHVLIPDVGRRPTPDVLASPDGSQFTVAWTRPTASSGDPDSSEPDSEIVLQSFGLDGTPRSPVRRGATASSDPGGGVADPRLAAPAGNRTALAWWEPSQFIIDPPQPCTFSFGAFVRTVNVPSGCADGLTLCLQDARFTATVTWTDPRTGDSGVGSAVPVTDDTGTFWFFEEENLELMVKVLDARPVNGHFWVFFGSLTDVEFTLTVTDTVTGNERTYTNPPFEMASRADTLAFDGE